MSDENVPADPQAFAAWMAQHGASTEFGAPHAHPSVGTPPVSRPDPGQFKALSAEVAEVLGSFKADLHDQFPTLSEDDITFYHRMWCTAYLNLVWAQVQTGNLNLKGDASD